MTTGEMMMEGVEVMLYGIGFVYLFLLLLIYCIKGMSLVVARFAPEHPVHRSHLARFALCARRVMGG